MVPSWTQRLVNSRDGRGVYHSQDILHHWPSHPLHCGNSRDKCGLSVSYQLQLTIKLWWQQKSRALKSFGSWILCVCLSMENQSLLMIVCRAADSCLKSEFHSALATSADVHLNSHSALATLRPSQHSAGRYPSSAAQFMLCLYWEPRQNYQFTCSETGYLV